MDLSMASRFKTTSVTLHRVSGETPPPKFWSSLSHCKGKLFLYGGAQWVLGGKTLPSNEMHILNLESMTWSLLLPDLVPRARMQHSSMVLSDTLLLIMGGYDGRDQSYLGHKDFAVLNLETNHWVVGARFPPEHQVPAHDNHQNQPAVNYTCEEVGVGVHSSVESYVCGVLPCKRGGMLMCHDPYDNGIWFCGGSQYVHQKWYRDVYKGKLEGIGVEVTSKSNSKMICFSNVSDHDVISISKQLFNQ